jgi:nitroreductase
MDGILPLIRKRRSIRRFQERKVEQEKTDLLIEAALRSPSSRGFNPWEFIVVTDRNLLERLSRAKQHGSAFLKNAPLGIVVCADPERSDVWIEDASIASIFIQIAAESLGLGSCWIQIRERMHSETISSDDYVSDVLGIPDGIRVESIIAVGYPDEKKPPHPEEDLEYEKVRLNGYGRPYED